MDRQNLYFIRMRCISFLLCFYIFDILYCSELFQCIMLGCCDESHAKQHDNIIYDQPDWKYQLGDSLHLMVHCMTSPHCSQAFKVVLLLILFRQLSFTLSGNERIKVPKCVYISGRVISTHIRYLTILYSSFVN